MFSTEFHSKICKSSYYCCNYITTKSATRHNRFASFILYETSRNFTRNNKIFQCFQQNFTQKYANRHIIAVITSRLYQQLGITGLSPSFYMKPPEILLGRIKIFQCFRQNFTQQYPNRHIIAVITSRLNQQLGITGLTYSFYLKPPEILLGRIKIFQCFRQNFTQQYPNRDIIAVITSRLNQQLGITGLTYSFYLKPPEILLGRIKIFQCFRQNFTQQYPNRHIIASITSRLNQELDITGLPPSFYMKPPEILLGRIKIFQCFRQNFTQKYPNRHIIAVITSRLNQELDITGLPPSFYMKPPEILLWRIKIFQCFRQNFTQKYPNPDIIAVITSSLNNQLDITGLPPSFYINPTWLHF